MSNLTTGGITSVNNTINISSNINEKELLKKLANIELELQRLPERIVGLVLESQERQTHTTRGNSAIIREPSKVQNRFLSQAGIDSAV